MEVRAPQPSLVAGALLTVLSSACVAAVTLVSTPTLTAAPSVPQPVRVVAAYQQAPAPVSLSFPEPAPAPVSAAQPVRPAAAEPAREAAAPADPLCAGDGWQARRGAAAVERLRRPGDARAVPISFRAARPDVLGLAHLEQRRVELFVRSCERQSDALLLHVLAHELGHVLDVARLTDDLRAQWMQARGIPADTPWFGCDGCTDFATPAGDFAETYAQWQRRATSNRSELAPAPSPAELEELAARFF